jgi:Na+-translocating ferredoxin:NAD+ oxidoreductase subunit C
MSAGVAIPWPRARLRTFPRGGVHPGESKDLTSRLAIRNAPVPSIAVVPMGQHMGKPAECIVAAGDVVREEALIGKAQGMFSASVHSPVPGKVTELREVFLPNGVRTQAVVIELAGEFDRSGKGQQRSDWSGLSRQELLERIADRGVVGLGGATFPTHVKYFVREGLKCEVFVANGVECEPFLTADHRLMLEKTDEILEGIAIVRKVLDPGRVVIGIEANKPDAIARMRERVRAAGVDYQVVPLTVKYPQGDEKQLLKAITGRDVPSGGLPIDIGAVVSNVGTLHAIFEALVYQRPLIERIVTVTGSCIANPGNLKVRVGTRIRDLIEECGGFTEPPAKIVAGGPMMGFAVADLDLPVTKGTSGILAISRRDAAPGEPTNCLSCGRCVIGCPFGLNPTRLYKLIDHLQYEAALAEGLMDCKECGVCSYICPAGIPLTQGLKLGKLVSRKKKKAG